MHHTPRNSQKSHLEIGIFLLPSPTIKEEALNMLGKIPEGLFNDKSLPNIPHISLYQMNIEEEKITQLTKILKRLSSLPEPLTLTMEEALIISDQNIFWNVILPNPWLENFHHRLVEAVKNLRALEPMQQVKDVLRTPLPLVFQEKIKEYGVYWSTPSCFSPHITIGYNLKQEKILEAQEAIKIIRVVSSLLKFRSPAIGIGSLGYQGNVIEILETIALTHV